MLDAAHIKPFALGGSHKPSNGLLLRQDVHTLFDRGYLTVTPDYHVEVSHRLKDEFDNGKEYYALHGKTILLPDAPSFRPSPQQLAWHNESVYRPCRIRHLSLAVATSELKPLSHAATKIPNLSDLAQPFW